MPCRSRCACREGLLCSTASEALTFGVPRALCLAALSRALAAALGQLFMEGGELVDAELAQADAIRHDGAAAFDLGDHALHLPRVAQLAIQVMERATLVVDQVDEPPALDDVPGSRGGCR